MRDPPRGGSSVAEAYRWTDLGTRPWRHGFHDTRHGRRFTIDPTVQTEILDRLLEINFERYADEGRQGLHKKAPKRKTGPEPTPSATGGLFAPDDEVVELGQPQLPIHPDHVVAVAVAEDVAHLNGTTNRLCLRQVD